MRDERRVLAKLAAHFDAAMKRGARAGLELDRFGCNVERLVPYGTCWPAEVAPKVAGLPPTFRRYFLGALRGAPWEQIAEALSVYWGFSLERDAGLRGCIARLLAIAPLTDALSWCRVIQRVAPAHRMHFAELLIESATFERLPDREAVKGLLRADELSPDPVYRHRMFHALSIVRAGEALGYILDGFFLANKYHERVNFDEVGAESSTGEAVEDLVAHLKGSADWSDSYALTLWNRCGQLADFKGLLRDPRWRALDASSAHQLSRTFTGLIYHDVTGAALTRKWRVVRRRAGELLDFVARVPTPYRLKAVDHLDEVIWVWDDPVQLDRALNDYLALLLRLCDQPFSTAGYAYDPLARLSALGTTHWQTVLQAADTSFMCLESATRRENDARLIACAFWSMANDIPELTAHAFATQPQPLLRAARRLGTLSGPARRELLRRFRAHPLVAVDYLAAQAADLVWLVDAHPEDRTLDPLPKRLRRYLHGELALRDEQVARDRVLLQQKWPALRLNVLGQLVVQTLAQGMPSNRYNAKVRHALGMTAAADEHRRVLKRLLSAYLKGNPQYAEAHPGNRKWRSAHPRIDIDTWTGGIRLTRITRNHGVIELGMESDPLEVLRLGSYVGTCLGLGGGLSRLAPAITLDINKQVVYARDASGQVIARQLLAISEHDQLVCYLVYPKRVDVAVRRAFRDYDRMLAQKLGIPVFDPSADHAAKPLVISILSQDFWDDGAWDLDVHSIRFDDPGTAARKLQ
jgi:hypothetical protein